MKILIALIAATTMLAACQNRDDRIAFDGKFFRAKVGKVDGVPQNFVVRVKPVSSSIKGAREAGRYEAATYCITNFGSSEILWSISPDAPEGSNVIEGDELVLQGSCPDR